MMEHVQFISFSMNTLLKNSHEPSLMLCGSNDSRKKKYPRQRAGWGMNIISLYMHNVPRYTLYKMSRSFR